MPLDLADMAQDLTETRLAKSLEKKRNTLTIPYSGHCLACGEEVHERRYCDSHCRETHEQQLRRKARLY